MQKNILLMDSSGVVHLVLDNLLKKNFSDINLHDFSNWGEVKDNFSEINPSLIFVDGYNGLEKIQELKKTSNTEDVPVFLTLSLKDSLKRKTVDTSISADMVFQRPFQPSKVIQAIENYLHVKAEKLTTPEDIENVNVIDQGMIDILNSDAFHTQNVRSSLEEELTPHLKLTKQSKSEEPAELGIDYIAGETADDELSIENDLFENSPVESIKIGVKPTEEMTTLELDNTLEHGASLSTMTDDTIPPFEYSLNKTRANQDPDFDDIEFGPKTLSDNANDSISSADNDSMGTAELDDFDDTSAENLIFESDEIDDSDDTAPLLDSTDTKVTIGTAKQGEKLLGDTENISLDEDDLPEINNISIFSEDADLLAPEFELDTEIDDDEAEEVIENIDSLDALDSDASTEMKDEDEDMESATTDSLFLDESEEKNADELLADNLESSDTVDNILWIEEEEEVDTSSMVQDVNTEGDVAELMNSKITENIADETSQKIDYSNVLDDESEAPSDFKAFNNPEDINETDSIDDDLSDCILFDEEEVTTNSDLLNDGVIESDQSLNSDIIKTGMNSEEDGGDLLIADDDVVAGEILEEETVELSDDADKSGKDLSTDSPEEIPQIFSDPKDSEAPTASSEPEEIPQIFSDPKASKAPTASSEPEEIPQIFSDPKVSKAPTTSPEPEEIPQIFTSHPVVEPNTKKSLEASQVKKSQLVSETPEKTDIPFNEEEGQEEEIFAKPTLSSSDFKSDLQGQKGLADGSLMQVGAPDSDGDDSISDMIIDSAFFDDPSDDEEEDDLLLDTDDFTPQNNHEATISNFAIESGIPANNNLSTPSQASALPQDQIIAQEQSADPTPSISYEPEWEDSYLDVEIPTEKPKVELENNSSEILTNIAGLLDDGNEEEELPDASIENVANITNADQQDQSDLAAGEASKDLDNENLADNMLFDQQDNLNLAPEEVEEEAPEAIQEESDLFDAGLVLDENTQAEEPSILPDDQPSRLIKTEDEEEVPEFAVSAEGLPICAKNVEDFGIVESIPHLNAESTTEEIVEVDSPSLESDLGGSLIFNDEATEVTTETPEYNPADIGEPSEEIDMSILEKYADSTDELDLALDIDLTDDPSETDVSIFTDKTTVEDTVAFEPAEIETLEPEEVTESDEIKPILSEDTAPELNDVDMSALAEDSKELLPEVSSEPELAAATTDSKDKVTDDVDMSTLSEDPKELLVEMSSDSEPKDDPISDTNQREDISSSDMTDMESDDVDMSLLAEYTGTQEEFKFSSEPEEELDIAQLHKTISFQGIDMIRNGESVTAHDPEQTITLKDQYGLSSLTEPKSVDISGTTDTKEFNLGESFGSLEFTNDDVYNKAYTPEVDDSDNIANNIELESTEDLSKSTERIALNDSMEIDLFDDDVSNESDVSTDSINMESDTVTNGLTSGDSELKDSNELTETLSSPEGEDFDESYVDIDSASIFNFKYSGKVYLDKTKSPKDDQTKPTDSISKKSDDSPSAISSNSTDKDHDNLKINFEDTNNFLDIDSELLNASLKKAEYNIDDLLSDDLLKNAIGQSDKNPVHLVDTKSGKTAQPAVHNEPDQFLKDFIKIDRDDITPNQSLDGEVEISSSLSEGEQILAELVENDKYEEIILQNQATHQKKSQGTKPNGLDGEVLYSLSDICSPDEVDNWDEGESQEISGDLNFNIHTFDDDDDEPLEYSYISKEALESAIFVNNGDIDLTLGNAKQSTEAVEAPSSLEHESDTTSGDDPKEKLMQIWNNTKKDLNDYKANLSYQIDNIIKDKEDQLNKIIKEISDKNHSIKK